MEPKWQNTAGLVADVYVLLVAEVGEQKAKAIWQAVPRRRTRRGPREQTRIACDMALSIRENAPGISNRQLYNDVEKAMAEVGRARETGSIARALYRHFPPYRAKKEAERALRGALMAARLLEQHPIDPSDTTCG